MNLRLSRFSVIRGACVGASLLAAIESQACINGMPGHGHPLGVSLSPVALKMRELTPLLAPKDDLLLPGKLGEPTSDFAHKAQRFAAALAYIRAYEARAGEASLAETINYSAALIHVDRAEQAVKALVALE